MPAEVVGVGMVFARVDGKTLAVQIVEAEAAGVADDEARGLGDDQVFVERHDAAVKGPVVHLAESDAVREGVGAAGGVPLDVAGVDAGGLAVDESVEAADRAAIAVVFEDQGDNAAVAKNRR